MLANVNFNYLDILCKNKLVEGMPNEFEHDYLEFGTYIQNKMNNIKSENNRCRAKDILDILHVDLNGPHSTGCKGEKYFLSIIDDFSKYAAVYTIKFKNEIYDCLTEFL